MYACQWSLDIIYGKQTEALAILRAWGEEKRRSSRFKRAKGTRVMVGLAGASASHVVDEYLFESLEEFEQALADMSKPQFRAHSDALAGFVVPGTQKWTIYRVVE